MFNNIIFLGGIHGVGKGTLCSKIKDQLDIEHLTASELLKWAEVNEDPKNKLVEDIQDMQDRLILGLKQRVEKGRKYLLDGHFCLFDSNGIPQIVPIKTFQKIAPEAIAVVTTDIMEVANRLKNRDGYEYNQNLLDEMQSAEINHASYVATELGIPFFEIKNGNSGELMEFLSN